VKFKDMSKFFWKFKLRDQMFAEKVMF